MMFSIEDFCSKCDQIRSFLRIWSLFQNKPLMENFIFYVLLVKLTKILGGRIKIAHQFENI